jgi:septum site-determining protein MinD
MRWRTRTRCAAPDAVAALACCTQVIVSTNRGEPLVLQKNMSLSGIAFENAARRLIGKQDYFVDLSNPHKGLFQKIGEMFGN